MSVFRHEGPLPGPALGLPRLSGGTAEPQGRPHRCAAGGQPGRPPVGPHRRPAGPSCPWVRRAASTGEWCSRPWPRSRWATSCGSTTAPTTPSTDPAGAWGRSAWPGCARTAFVSLDAGESGGTVLTRPFLCAGGPLLLNIDARGGEGGGGRARPGGPGAGRLPQDRLRPGGRRLGAPPRHLARPSGTRRIEGPAGAPQALPAIGPSLLLRHRLEDLHAITRRRLGHPRLRGLSGGGPSATPDRISTSSRAGVLQRIHHLDFNRDGYVDLVFCNAQVHMEAPPAFVYRDVFGARQCTELPAGGSPTAAVADISGDGYADLVIGQREERQRRPPERQHLLRLARGVERALPDAGARPQMHLGGRGRLRRRRPRRPGLHDRGQGAPVPSDRTGHRGQEVRRHRDRGGAARGRRPRRRRLRRADRHRRRPAAPHLLGRRGRTRPRPLHRGAGAGGLGASRPGRDRAALRGGAGGAGSAIGDYAPDRR